MRGGQGGGLEHCGQQHRVGGGVEGTDDGVLHLVSERQLGATVHRLLGIDIDAKEGARHDDLLSLATERALGLAGSAAHAAKAQECDYENNPKMHGGIMATEYHWRH